MRKETVTLPVSQAKIGRISVWLTRENVLFSSLMEERVSNCQALLLTQFLTSFTLLTCSVFLYWPGAVACLIWFGGSMVLCKKGGIE
jgi:hypothetical protein